MMKPKFQVGDLVRICKDVPCGAYGPDGVWCNDDMHAHRGMEFAIAKVTELGRYFLADPSGSFEDLWVWEESFLEPVETNIEVDATLLL